MITNSELKIVSVLEENGRASYAELSRTIGLSVSTIAKRVRRLIDDGVMTINAVPNPHRLGLVAHALIAIKTSVDKLEYVCDQLASFPNIDLIVALFGRFNLIMSVQFMNWDNLHDFITTELSAIHDISDMEIYFTKENKKRAYDIFQEKVGRDYKLNIDKIDKEIIDTLCIDGRYSVSNLANKLNLSVSSVSKRISRLYDENAIKVRAVVDHNKVGLHANAFVMVRAEHNQIEHICDNMRNYEEIRTIITLINGYDILINVISKDAESLYDLVNNRIAHIPGVTDLETWLRGKIFKRYYGPLPITTE